MPKPNKDQFLNMNNMPFTDQRDFIKALVSTIFTQEEIELGFSRRNITITKQNIIDALNKSLVMQKQVDRISSDFTLDNLKEISNNHINNVRSLIENGKMVENIQTKDNTFDSPDYEAFTLNRIETQLISKFSSLNENDKKNLLSFNLKEKDIISNYSNLFNEQGMTNYFGSLTNELFKTVNDAPSNQKNESPIYKNEITKDNVIRYANDIKTFNDMMHKKPWYIRWFSPSYSRKKQVLEAAKGVLYNFGISKDSLNKFIKSHGVEEDKDKLFDLNKESIDKVNLNYKKSLEDTKKEQKEVDFKNAEKNIEDAVKAQETLDKLVDINIDPGLNDEYFENEKQKKEEEKAYYENILNTINVGQRQKKEIRNQINDLDKEIDNIDKLKENSRKQNTVYNDMDDLSFDASKDIIESSDDLKSKLGMEFDDDYEIKDTLEAFNDDSEIKNNLEI